jgi:hypothetical protein
MCRKIWISWNQPTFSTLIVGTKVPESFFFVNLGIILILVLRFYSGLSGRRLIFSMNFSYHPYTSLSSHIPSFYHPTNRPIWWIWQFINLISCNLIRNTQKLCCSLKVLDIKFHSHPQTISFVLIYGQRHYKTWRLDRMVNSHHSDRPRRTS